MANLQQPLSLGCAEPAPLEGEPRGCAPPEVLRIEGQPLSQPAADSIPTPFVPSGHFPTLWGITLFEGAYEGNLFKSLRFYFLRFGLS